MGFFRRHGSELDFAEVARAVLACAKDEAWDRAWDAAQPLVKAQPTKAGAVSTLLDLLDQGALGLEHGLDAAKSVFEARNDDPSIVSALGRLVPMLHDVRYLNAAPPVDPFFAAVATRLQTLLKSPSDRAAELAALYSLATSARILGRSWDDTAEHAALRIVELAPERWQSFYDLGLLYKTRGRFAEGQAANQRAMDLGGSEDEAVVWNLGICATGAGDSEVALRVWKGMGQKIEMGRFGLPEGGYPSTKVRLAQRPLAERNPATEPDDPGSEETIWVERLSPCHGVIRSAVYYDEVGVDFGDVVLFDGAPITHHQYGDKTVPVFPHLATLRRSRYHIFPFAGTQRHERQIAALSEELPDDAVLYVHTEQVSFLCMSCWEKPGQHHSAHARGESSVVTGKLRLLVPDLAREAGDAERAEIEKRRMSMIESVEK